MERPDEARSVAANFLRGLGSELDLDEDDARLTLRSVRGHRVHRSVERRDVEGSLERLGELHAAEL